MIAVLKAHQGAHVRDARRESLAASWGWWRDSARYLAASLLPAAIGLAVTACRKLRPAVRQAPEEPVPAGVAGTGTDPLPGRVVTWAEVVEAIGHPKADDTALDLLRIGSGRDAIGEEP